MANATKQNMSFMPQDEKKNNQPSILKRVTDTAQKGTRTKHQIYCMGGPAENANWPTPVPLPHVADIHSQ